MTMTIIERLRGPGRTEFDIELAADMLEFFFGQLQAHSPKMDGTASYRFRGGWPMTCAIGNCPELAILNAMSEVILQKLNPPKDDGGV